MQFAGELCAYHLPGGSFAMRFTGSDFIFVPDGAGGRYLDGTFWLLGTALAEPMNTASALSAVHKQQSDDRALVSSPRMGP